MRSSSKTAHKTLRKRLLISINSTHNIINPKLITAPYFSCTCVSSFCLRFVAAFIRNGTRLISQRHRRNRRGKFAHGFVPAKSWFWADVHKNPLGRVQSRLPLLQKAFQVLYFFVFSSNTFFTNHFLAFSYSINADDTESELAAIPESPKSDSTLHGSSTGSFGEIEEAATMKKPSLGKSLSVMASHFHHSTDTNGTKHESKGSRLNWFLGSEDHGSDQVRRNVHFYVISRKLLPSIFQKKCTLHEGVKILVKNALMSGQSSMAKTQEAPGKSAAQDNGKTRPDLPNLVSTSTAISGLVK